MPALARFMNFCDFHDFWKTVAAAFLGISKIPIVNFEINSFSFYLFKKFCFPMTHIYAREVELGFETERFFGYAAPITIK